MQKPQTKQVIVSEAEATLINNILKEKMLLMIRERDYDFFSMDILARLQERYEGIVVYIRRKGEEREKKIE